MATIFPPSPSVDDEYQGYKWDGTTWNLIGNQYNPASYSASAPSNPKPGDIWIESDVDVPSISPETILTTTAAASTYQPLVSGVSNTEIGYLDGVTSSIQTQLNSKANLSGATFTGTIIAPSGSSIGALQITSGLIQSSGDINISAAATTDTTDISSSVRMQTVYNKTSSSASNLLIATNPLGYLYRSTASSGRWKNSIEDLNGDLDATKLLELPVHKFKFNDDYLSEDDQRYGMYVPGFIAEEVAEVYPIAAEHDEDGLPSDWNSRLLLPPMLKLIQDQAQKITELEHRISIIEGDGISG